MELIAKAINQVSIAGLGVTKNAEQTSLPALNAAIQATRAGEQSSRFARVADEIHLLALRAQQLTTEM